MYTYGCGFCYDIDVSDLDLRTEDELFRDCKSVEDCKLYIEKYPSGKNIDKIRFKLHELQLNQCKTIKDYETYISTCTITSLKKKAIDKLEITIGKDANGNPIKKEISKLSETEFAEFMHEIADVAGTAEVKAKDKKYEEAHANAQASGKSGK